MRVCASPQGLESIKYQKQQQRWKNEQICLAASKLRAPHQDWDSLVADGTYAEGCSVPTLKNFLQGKAIEKTIFITFCQVLGVNWQEVFDTSDEKTQQLQTELEVRQSATELSKQFWVGRSTLLAALTEQKQQACRMIILTGMMGIGKTALAHQVGQVLQQQGFKVINAFPFDDSRSTDFVSFAVELLVDRLQLQVTMDDRDNSINLISKILHELANSNYLIQLDSIERLLVGNNQTGWNNFKDESWLNFFQVILEMPDFRSKIVLTSRAFPCQLQELALDASICNRWHSQTLVGLSPEEQLALFQKLGVIDLQQLEKSEYWQRDNCLCVRRISLAYEGHPLALLAIAGEILTDFSGDVMQYWTKYGREIEKQENIRHFIELESLDDRLKLEQLTDYLKRYVQPEINQVLDRLQQDLPHAYELLLAGAVFRRSVVPQGWFRVLRHWQKGTGTVLSDKQLLTALEALFDRYLVEVETISDQLELIRQHNLVRSVALRRAQKFRAYF